MIGLLDCRMKIYEQLLALHVLSLSLQLGQIYSFLFSSPFLDTSYTFYVKSKQKFQ